MIDGLEVDDDGGWVTKWLEEWKMWAIQEGDLSRVAAVWAVEQLKMCGDDN